MAVRRRFYTVTALNSGDMSGNLTSDRQILEWETYATWQATWSGTSPVGVLQIQFSNDDTNWTDLSGFTYNLSGNSGSWGFQQVIGGAPYYRAVYTRTSGTGTLTITLAGR
jgi:hypothetical protein